MRRWISLVVVVLAVLDLAVLAVGYRARSGVLPSFQQHPDPQFTMQPESTTDDPSASATSGATESGGPTVAGPLMLSMGGGVIVRATRGACEARFANPAEVAVASFGDPTAASPVEVPDIREVLGLAVQPDGRVRVAGLDADCQAVTLDSSDEGQTWDRLANKTSGIWELSGDTTSTSLSGPAGKPVEVGCVPVQVTNLPDQRALASCTSGLFYALSRGSAPVAVGASSFGQVSAAAGPRPGTYYVFGTTTDCAGQVGFVDVDKPDDFVARACMDENAVPLGIASSGTKLVVQFGNALLTSTDGGTTLDSGD